MRRGSLDEEIDVPTNVISLFSIVMQFNLKVLEETKIYPHLKMLTEELESWKMLQWDLRMEEGEKEEKSLSQKGEFKLRRLDPKLLKNFGR